MIFAMNQILHVSYNCLASINERLTKYYYIGLFCSLGTGSIKVGHCSCLFFLSATKNEVKANPAVINVEQQGFQMTTSSGSLEIGRQLLHKADNKLPNYRRLTGDRLTERQTESFGHLGHNLNLMRYASTTKTPVLYTFDKQKITS